ncbi:nodulation protein S (NodS) [Paraburkholderia sp. BL8N3]|jgi:SAM-dependent methyltransferase|nr:SAM-dependent methyltransferase [Paraburkholderia sp. BL8N3]TCK42274.1 nodulation protein S (NodS) [Paraburkholderia sp. BL8N3]
MTGVPLALQYFDGLYAQSDDPWLLRERWYERRKRALTLAMLPDERYVRAFEPGCANGELTAALAPRCGALLAADLSEEAVALARRRVAHLSHVHVERRAVPDDWPDGRFDLIVISELAYYLDPAQVSRLIERVTATLAPGGTLLACHWRRPIEGWSYTGDTIHAELMDKLAIPLLSHYQDDDVVIHVLSSNAASVHQREGR